MINFIIGLFIGTFSGFLIACIIVVGNSIKEDEELFAKIEEQEKDFESFTYDCLQDEEDNKDIAKII